MNKSVFMLLALCGLLSCYSGSAQHYRWQQDDTTVTESGGAQTAAVDNFGNMYVSATQFTPSGLPGVTFLMKEDMNTGLIKWKKAIPGPSNETTITTDRKGNVYLFFPGHIAFNSDSYEILKTDSSGNIIWTKVVQAFGLTSYNWVAPYAITTDNFGYFYVSGWTNTSGITEGSDTLTAGPGQPFSFIVKYDTAGHKIWSKVFSATGYTTAPGIVADQAGDLLVGATTDSAVAFRDTTVALPFEGSALIVAKCDSNLNLKWIAINKHTPNINFGDYIEKSVEITTDGAGNGYLALALSGSDSLGNFPISYSFIKDLAVAKYQSHTGNVQWALAGGVSTFFSLATNLSGNSYFVFSGGYSPHYFGDSVFSQGFSTPLGDATVVGLDSFGIIHCGFAVGGSLGDDEVGMAIDNAGFGYLYSDYKDSVQVGTTILRSPASLMTLEEYFAAKFSCSGLNTEIHQVAVAADGPEIFPNPATNELFIKTDNSIYTSFAVSNTLGQIVLQQSINSPQTTTNVSALPNGAYYVILSGSNGRVVKKFMKM